MIARRTTRRPTQEKTRVKYTRQRFDESEARHVNSRQETTRREERMTKEVKYEQDLMSERKKW